MLDPGCPFIPLQLSHLGQVGRVMGFLDFGVEAPPLHLHKSGGTPPHIHLGCSKCGEVKVLLADLYRLEHRHDLSLRTWLLSLRIRGVWSSLQDGSSIVMATRG